MKCFEQKIREFSKYQKALIWSALSSAKYMNENSMSNSKRNAYQELLSYFAQEWYDLSY